MILRTIHKLSPLPSVKVVFLKLLSKFNLFSFLFFFLFPISMYSMDTVTLSSSRSSTISASKHSKSYKMTLGRINVDNEIGVFSAEKYFNGVMDENKAIIKEKEGRKYHPKKEEPTDLKSTKMQKGRGSPSACSEASWTSRSALLQILNEQPTNRHNKASGRRFLTSFCCRCICSDKKSVSIDENVSNGTGKKGTIQEKIVKAPVDMNTHPIKESKVETQLERIQCRSIDKVNPVLQVSKPEPGDASDGKQTEEMVREKARKSLELFGSPIVKLGDRTLSLERRLRMLTWDVSPREKNFRVAAASEVCDDADSDSSSDLFEIDHISDYESTKLSDNWEQVTTSAANFITVLDINKDKSAVRPVQADQLMFHMKTPTTTETKTATSSKTEIGEEAVKMTGDAYKKEILNMRKHQTSDPLAPRGMFQTDNMVTGFLSAHSRHAAGFLQAS